MKYGKRIFVALLVTASLTLLASGASGTEKDAAASINDVICLFIRLIWMVTAALAAIVIIFAGLRYLLSGDDAAARSSSKQLIMGAFVGIIIIFIAVPVVNYVVSGFVDSFQCDLISGSSSSKDLSGNEPNTMSADKGSGPQAQEKPDLAITGFSFEPDPKTKDMILEDYIAWVTVKNLGAIDSSEFKTSVFWDDEELCFAFSFGLKKSEEKKMKCGIGHAKWQPVVDAVTAGGSEELKVAADPDNMVDELLEDNNKKTVKVEGLLKPGTVQVATAESESDECGGQCGGLFGIGAKTCSQNEICRDGSCEFSESCCSKKCGEATCLDDKGNLQTCGTAQRCVANDAGTGCVCASPRTGEELRDCCYGRCGVVNCGDDVCVFKSSTPYTSFCYCGKSSDFKCNYISETDTSCLDSGCGGRCPGAKGNVEKTVDGIAVCNKNSACRPTLSGYDCLERASTLDCFEGVEAPSGIVPVNPLEP